MINEGVVHGTTSPPLRLDVAKWVHNAILEMRKAEGKIIGNAWKRHRYVCVCVCVLTSGRRGLPLHT